MAWGIGVVGPEGGGRGSFYSLGPRLKRGAKSLGKMGGPGRSGVEARLRREKVAVITVKGSVQNN